MKTWRWTLERMFVSHGEDREERWMALLCLWERSCHHNHFTALFPGPPGWAGARRELLDFMVQGEINRGLGGRHSIQSNQCPPRPSPPHFLRAGCPSCCPANSVKALKALRKELSVTSFCAQAIWSGYISNAGSDVKESLLHNASSLFMYKHCITEHLRVLAYWLEALLLCRLCIGLCVVIQVIGRQVIRMLWTMIRMLLLTL